MSAEAQAGSRDNLDVSVITLRMKKVYANWI